MNEALQDELEQSNQHEPRIAENNTTIVEEDAIIEPNQPLEEVGRASHTARSNLAQIAQRKGASFGGNSVDSGDFNDAQLSLSQLSPKNPMSSSVPLGWSRQLTAMTQATSITSKMQRNQIAQGDIANSKVKHSVLTRTSSAPASQLNIIQMNLPKEEGLGFEEEEIIEEIIDADEGPNFESSTNQNNQSTLDNNLKLGEELESKVLGNNKDTTDNNYFRTVPNSNIIQYDLESQFLSNGSVLKSQSNGSPKLQYNQKVISSRRSSRGTIAARDDPHIDQVPSLDPFSSLLKSQNALTCQSLDEQRLTRNLRLGAFSTREQSQNINLNEPLLGSLNPFNKTQVPQNEVEHRNNVQSMGDFDEEGGFEITNYDFVVSAVGNKEENKKEGDEIDEEEKQYLLEVMDQEEEEPLQMRGRNSVLEEVEDDDIVNQNSSKGSSKERFTSNVSQESRKADSTIQATINVLNQNVKEEAKKQTEVPRKQKQSCSQSSLTSSRSSNKYQGGTRFTYFAASSLSDDRWLCPICLDIFEDAVETPCCHNLFCDKCIKQTPMCPLCNQRVVGQLKPNIPIRRLVLELSVSCVNIQCEQVIRKGDMEKHVKVCHYTPLDCPNSEKCGQIIRKYINKHTKKICPYRIVECFLGCGLMLALNDMEDHIHDECLKTQIPCQNLCGSIVERGEIERHISVECPLEVIDCPNKGDSLFEEGCPIRLKRKEMESHKVVCSFRRVQCPNHKCSSIIMYKDLPSHDERCLFKVIDCDNKCGQKVQRQKLDQHKEACEFQLVKCDYYSLGCKIEVLRKDYKAHLHEEGFNHSIIFIQGQRKKNREIDELKSEICNLRKDYDVEIKTMFLELTRVKDELIAIKDKTGIQCIPNSKSNNNQNGPMVGGSGSGLNKKDERRYENPNYSLGSGSINDYQFKAFLQRERERQPAPDRENQNMGGNLGALRILGAFGNSNSVEADSNAASIAASMQSFGTNSNNQHIYTSQQFRHLNPLTNNNANPSSNNAVNNQGPNRVYSKPPLIGRATQNNNNQQNIRNSNTNSNIFLFSENSQRGRIPLGPNNQTDPSVINFSERKNNPLAAFLGSMNASQESLPNQNAQRFSNQRENRDYWDDIAAAYAFGEMQQQQNNGNIQGQQHISGIRQPERSRKANQTQRRDGEPDSNRNNRNSNQGPPRNQDLDSSNVLYDDDFEIEEEKLNF